jgi:hypothetical protein
MQALRRNHEADMSDSLPSKEWFTPWRAAGLAVYDTRGQLVAHTGITGNRSMQGEQLERMAAMIADAVNAHSSDEPLVRPNGHDDARERIALRVREIEIICDEFGYDPHEYLADCEIDSPTPPPSADLLQRFEILLSAAENCAVSCTDIDNARYGHNEPGQNGMPKRDLPIITVTAKVRHLEELNSAIERARAVLTKGVKCDCQCAEYGIHNDKCSAAGEEESR